MKKRIAAMIMALLMLLVVCTPTAVQAANTSPYCRISYDSSLGCNTVKYYSYVGGVAKYDASRLVKFYDGKVLLGTSNTTLTSKHKSGTNPAWTADGSYLVWIETDNSAWAHQYGGNTNVKIAANISSMGINADSMVETLSLTDGKVVSVSEAIASAQKGIVVSGNTASSNKPEENQQKPDNTVPTTPSTSTTPTQQPSTSAVQNFIDSAGYEHFVVDTVDIKVNGATVYFNSYIISELCNSGVRFLGIDCNKNVYLYEDSSNSYYKFSSLNIFNPEKIQFATGCTLTSVETDTNGFLVAVVTTAGKFTVQQLVTSNSNVISVTYAINKEDYSSYYSANGTYKANCTNGILYLGTTKIAEQVEAFGFQEDKLIYVKNNIAYKTSLETPTSASIWKQNVARLTYSSENGLVTGVTRLTSKQNYVKNSANQAVLYQSSKSAHTIKLNSKKTKVYFDGHVIAKLSKKQIKAGKKYSYVGFTETNQVVYSEGTSQMVIYKTSISNANKLNFINKAKKWSVSSLSRDSLGFMIGK